MLQRYDHRLAEFAQALNDALNQTLPARSPPRSPERRRRPAMRAPDHSNVVRVLELAREQTSADAAVAIVGTKQEPILATVGLSQARSHRSGASGARLPGSRAIQVSFNGDDAPNGGYIARAIRRGLAIPLMDSSTEPGMLAVLTRTPDRRSARSTSRRSRSAEHQPTGPRDLARAAGARPRARSATHLRTSTTALHFTRCSTRDRLVRGVGASISRSYARRRSADDDQRPNRPSRRRRRPRDVARVLNDVATRETCRAASEEAASAVHPLASGHPRRRAALRAASVRVSRTAAPRDRRRVVLGRRCGAPAEDDATALSSGRTQRSRSRRARAATWS